MKHSSKTLALAAALLLGGNAFAQKDMGLSQVQHGRPAFAASAHKGIHLDLFAEDFDAGELGAWTITDGGGSDNTWMFVENYDGASTLDGTPFIMADSDEAGNVLMDEILQSPAVDLTGQSLVVLKWHQVYRTYTGADEAEVLVWDGTEWQSVYTSTTDEGTFTAPALKEINVTEYINDDFQVRFHYKNATFEWYWAIDNVILWSPDFADDLQAAAARANNTPWAGDFTPSVHIANQGSVAQTFSISLTITDEAETEVYSSTLDVTEALEPLADMWYDMADMWSPTATGLYSLEAIVINADDADMDNDTASTLARIRFEDAPISTDNYAPTATTGLISSMLQGLDPDGLVQSADDFIVPAGTTWTISEIATAGFSQSTSLPPSSFTVEIYYNDNGAPGETMFSHVYENATDQSNQLFEMETPITLAPGTYWLSVWANYATATAFTQARWNWYAFSNDDANSAHLRDRMGAFELDDEWYAFGDIGVANVNSLYFLPFGSIDIEPVLYEYTFTITSSEDGSPIEGATINIPGHTLTTDASGMATFVYLLPGEYAYSIEAEDHIGATGSFTIVDADGQDAIELVWIPNYMVSFHVMNADMIGFEGATVEFGEWEATTDADGWADFFGVAEGEYDYTVTLAGYDTETGTLTVDGADVEENVTLTMTTYAIEFNCDMTVQIEVGAFDPEVDFLDIGGTLNNWGADEIRLVDEDGDGVYTATVEGFLPGSDVEYKYRMNGNWETSEFPNGGPNRMYTVIYADPNVINDEYNNGDIVAVEAIGSMGINMFPNPAAQVVNFSNVAGASIELFNLLGQRVLSVNNAQQNHAIDLGQLPAGSYLVRVTKGGELSSARLNVVR